MGKFVWNPFKLEFELAPDNWILDYKPQIYFSGTIIFNNSGIVTFIAGEIKQYNLNIVNYLPDLILALSRNETSGSNWKILNQVHNEKIILGSKATAT